VLVQQRLARRFSPDPPFQPDFGYRPTYVANIEPVADARPKEYVEIASRSGSQGGIHLIAILPHSALAGLADWMPLQPPSRRVRQGRPKPLTALRMSIALLGLAQAHHAVAAVGTCRIAFAPFMATTAHLGRAHSPQHSGPAHDQARLLTRRRRANEGNCRYGPLLVSRLPPASTLPCAGINLGQALALPIPAACGVIGLTTAVLDISWPCIFGALVWRENSGNGQELLGARF